MKNYATLILTASLITLAGCSSQDPNKREAGKWQNKMELESVKLSGLPKGMEAQGAQLESQMKQQFAAQFSGMNQEECLSKDAAAKENIGQDITKGMSGGADCKFDKNSVANGKLDVAGNCTAGGKTMKIAVTGNVTPKKVDAVLSLNADPSGSGLAMQPGLDIKMKVTQTHSGACS